jgi:hypothetical protein
LAVHQKYQDFADIELVGQFLKMNEVIRYRARPDELDELIGEIKNDIADIRGALRLNAFPTREGNHCRWCEYVTLCPAKRHQLLLEREADTDGDKPVGARAAAEVAEEYIRIDSRQKELKAERDALRRDLIHLAQEMELDKFSTKLGEVTVRRSSAEKFITSTDDSSAFAELSRLVRQWQMDEYFKLDGKAFMKEIYRRQRLNPEQLEMLKPFVKPDDSTTVRVKKGVTDEDED